MNNKRIRYFEFNIVCVPKRGIHNDIAMEILRGLNVRWKDCMKIPPNIFTWKDIELHLTNDDMKRLNNFMECIREKYQKLGKIHNLYWWYNIEKSDDK